MSKKKYNVSNGGRRHSLPPHSNASNRSRASSLGLSTPTRKLFPLKSSTSTQPSRKPTVIGSPQDIRDSPAYLAQQREKHRKAFENSNRRRFSVATLPPLDDVYAKLDQKTANDALFQNNSKPEKTPNKGKSSITDSNPKKEDAPPPVVQIPASDADEPPRTAKCKKQEKEKSKKKKVGKTHSKDSKKTSKKHHDFKDSKEKACKTKDKTRDKDPKHASWDSVEESGTETQFKSEKKRQKGKARKTRSAATESLESAYLHGSGNISDSSTSESEAADSDQEAQVSVVRKAANATTRSPKKPHRASIKIEAAEDAGDEASTDEDADEVLQTAKRMKLPEMSSVQVTPTGEPQRFLPSSPTHDSTPTPKTRKRKVSSTIPEVNIVPSSKRRKTSPSFRGDAAQSDSDVESKSSRTSSRASSSEEAFTDSDASSLEESSKDSDTGSTAREGEKTGGESSAELATEEESAAKTSTVATRNPFPELLAMPGVQSAITAGSAKPRRARRATAIVKEDKSGSKKGNAYSKKVMSAAKALEKTLPIFNMKNHAKKAPEAWLIEVLEQAKHSLVRLAAQRITENGGPSLKMHQQMIRIAKERHEQLEQLGALRDRILQTEE
jgi:hypothetical protein